MKYLLSSNAKYRKRYRSSLRIFGLPAFRSKDGHVTCPGAGECVHGCYACQGWYDRRHVRTARERNLALARSVAFIETIKREIKSSPGLQYIRLHDSGDFFSIRYFEHWLKIMRDHLNIVFFAYTKMVPMIFEHRDELPKNFYVVFSEGGKWDDLIRGAYHRFPIARIFRSAEDMHGTGFINATTGDDLKLVMDGVKKLGLVYHGRPGRWWATDGTDPTLFRRS